MILLRFSPGRFPLRKFSSSSSKDIPSKIPVAPSLVQKKCEIVSIPLISATTRGNPKENIQFFVRSWTVTTGQSPLVKKMQNIAEWDETKEKPHKIKATIDKWVDWGGKYWERLGKVILYIRRGCLTVSCLEQGRIVQEAHILYRELLVGSYR